MATLNPVAVVRDVSNNPSHTRELHEICGRISGGGAHAVTVETRLVTVLSAVCVNETDAALLATTIAASTAYPGTKKVTFTVANAKDYSYRITGLLKRTATVDTTGGAVSVLYNPIVGE